MKRASLLLISAVLLVAAACSSDSKTSSSSSSSSTSSSSSPSSSSSSASASPASGGATGAATLAAATNAKIGKSILTDSKGMTVYLYMPDASSKTSTVPAGLKQLWPAVTATGAGTASSGLDSSKLTLEPQADGTMQVAYNGHLLYTFQNDKAAGDANGQGLGNVWYVLGADGNQIDND
jgi:predicted lipoprotein with Yx(FWY)xxD motif